MMKKNKLLVIGWDAADWKSINPLIDRGLMPNLEKLINEGVMGNIATLDPPLSPMLWTSIATGKRPFKHGILGFTEPKTDGSGVQPVLNTSRKCKAIWNILNQEGYKSHVVGWWPSHPAEPINGTMVSNFYQKAKIPKEGEVLDFWPMLKDIVHPKRLSHILAKLRIHPYELTAAHLAPFLPNLDKIDQSNKHIQAGLTTLRRLIADCTSIHNAATYLMQFEEWDFCAVYYDAIDHFGHAFMKYHPPKRDFIPQDLYDAFFYINTAGYRYHDMMLGRLMQLIDDETTVILLSDHGFHPDHMRPKIIPKIPAGPALEHNPYGVVIIKGPNIKKDERVYGASLLDVTPTILSILDQPVAEDMDGKVLTDIFEKPKEVRYINSWEDIEGNDGMHPPEKLNDPFVDQEAMEQLIELGYIDRPDENAEKAIRRTMDISDYFLAQSYIDANMHDLAEPIVERLFLENTDKPIYGFTLVNVLQRLGKIDKAREILNLLKANNDLKGPNIALLEARILGMENRAEEALAKLVEAEVKSKDNDTLYQYIGYYYLKLDNWIEAERAYKKALKINPDSYVAHYGLGYAFYNQRLHERSAQHLIEAIALLYHQPMAHFLLGKVLHELGDEEGSIRAFGVAQKQNSAIAAKKQAKRKSKLGSEESVSEQNIGDLIKSGTEKEIVIVSGLPRSGTSMMMQMLEKGGIAPFTDGKREADENNKKGYYEHEAIKKLHKDNSILQEIDGKAVKVVAQLLPNLPLKYRYKILFMRRPLDEILSSQDKMLKRLDRERNSNMTKLRASYTKRIEQVNNWAKNFPNVDLLEVDYNEAIDQSTHTCSMITNFLSDYDLNVEKMASVVDNTLRREQNKL